ncbi:MAG: hypothetical protein WA580_05510 [Acidimicrobiales bacterium]
MSVSDYVVDILLIALVLRQLRARQLTIRVVILPIVLVVWAWTSYFHTFAANGHDYELIGVFVVVGLALGIASGLTTKVWESNQQVMFQAGVWAAVTWIAGMGFRLGFQIWATSTSGQASLTRFSIRHHITGPEAWVCALLLMALCEVLGRLGILQWRLYSRERDLQSARAR